MSSLTRTASPSTTPLLAGTDAPPYPFASGPEASGGREGLRVLMIEDNPGDARLIRELFGEQSAVAVELDHAGRLADGLKLLADGSYDAVLLDLSFPGESQGLETLAQVQGQCPGLPVLVLSGLSDEGVAIEAVHQGAQDYLVKGDVDPRMLVRSIRYAIERQRMTTELEESRRTELELKDRFLSHVSHELRSPLSAIYQFVTILLDGLVGDLDDEKREVVEVILRNTDQLRTMIEDLLEVTRAQTGKLVVEPVWMDLSKTLDAVVATYRPMLKGRGLAMEIEVPRDLPRVHGDPGRVQQVLTNFLDNAAKSTASGGRIVIRVRNEPEDGSVRIEVEDTGCGIEPDQQRQIFERLYQGGTGPSDGKAGLGLGLYICRLLVTRQGGRIGLSSEPGQGSTFWFTLPALSVAQVLEPLLSGQAPSAAQTMILLKIGVERADGANLADSDTPSLQRFWDILERCSLPDLDVLFPQGIGRKHRAVFLMAMVADQAGADALEHRIRRQSNRIAAFENSRLVASFERSSLRLEDSTDPARKDGLEAVAKEVERLINAFLEEGAPDTERSPA